MLFLCFTILFVFTCNYIEGTGSSFWHFGCYYSASNQSLTSDLVAIEDLETYQLAYANSFKSQSSQQYYLLVTHCCQTCHRFSYELAALNFHEECKCLNNSSVIERVDTNCSIRGENEFADSAETILDDKHVWDVYTASGPYIVNLTQVGTTHAVQYIPTVLEIVIHIAEYINISQDVPHSPFDLHVKWFIENETVLDIINGEKKDAYARIPFTFEEDGNFSVEVEVSNTVSVLSTTFVIQVVPPKPLDLQLSLWSEGFHQVPSCIPASYNVTTLAPDILVFQNHTIVFEVSVNVGINLTYLFDVDGAQTLDSREHDFNCTHKTCLLPELVFENPGLHSISGSVWNQFGIVNKTWSLVVIEHLLRNVSFSVRNNPLSGPLVPMQFLVTMEITNRFGGILVVDFSDGHVYKANLEDTNSSTMALHCSHGEMYVAADYGEGCDLTLEFEHSYDMQGTFVPHLSIQSMFLQVEESLNTEISIESHLDGLKIKADKIILTNTDSVFSAHLSSNSENFTVYWVISDQSHNVEVNLTTNINLSITHSFSRDGIYLVTCIIKNRISQVEASTTIEVIVPIQGLQISCNPEYYIAVEDVLLCHSSVEGGSDIKFKWQTYPKMAALIKSSSKQNISQASIVFQKQGHYNISVSAFNKKSKVLAFFSHPMQVQNPVRFVRISNNVIYKPGETANLTIYCDGVDVKYDIDYGEGKGWVNLRSVTMALFSRFQVQYKFTHEGAYRVNVSACNKVSCLYDDTIVLVQEPVPSFKLHFSSPAVVNRTTIIYANLTKVHNDILFDWMVDHQPIRGQGLLASCVLPYIFNESGLHSITLKVTNYNSESIQTAQLLVLPSDTDQAYLQHDTFLHLDSSISLSIENKQNLSEVDQIQFEPKDAVENVNDNKLEWHLVTPGLLTIVMSLIHHPSNNSQMISSALLVQEQIEGLQIIGPDIIFLEEHKNDTLVFLEANTTSGSNLLYEWSVINTSLSNAFGNHDWSQSFCSTPSRRIKIHGCSFHSHGYYIVRARVINVLQRQEVTKHLRVVFPVVGLKVIAPLPEPLGHTSLINISFCSGPGYKIFIDGGQEDENDTKSHFEVAEGDARVKRMEYVRDIPNPYFPCYLFVFNQTFKSKNTYHVRVNVSNPYSWSEKSTFLTIGEPITGLKIWSNSPHFVDISEEVVVMASVETGNDLSFTWNPRNMYPTTKEQVDTMEKRSILRIAFANQGQYNISVAVSNFLYREPITASLPFSFHVVERIAELYVIHDNNYPKGAPLLISENGLSTDEIIIKARSDGSDLHYVFDFGDGTSVEIIPQEIFFPLPNYGLVSHRYSQEGAYNISVTAYNRISQKSASFPDLFSVLIPPRNLRLDTNTYNTLWTNITYFNASIDSGTNVTFDWKFGDQSDLINQGPKVQHKYKSPGEYTVSVIARNRVSSSSTSAVVYVMQHIQDVELEIPKSLCAVDETLELSAKIFPLDLGVIYYYQWNFGNQHGEEWTKEPQIVYKCTSVGRHVMTVKAGNHFSSVQSTPHILHVQSHIKRLSIRQKGTIVNQHTTLEANAFAGSDIFYDWDLGDGTRRLNVSDNLVVHAYKSIGKYTITLRAFNRISEETITMDIFILNETCYKPEIKVHSLDGGQNSVQILRSQKLHLEAEVPNLRCDNSDYIKFTWTFYNISTGKELKIHNVHRSHLERKVLLLPPKTLSHGSWNLVVKAEVLHLKVAVYSEYQIQVNVEKSPLVAVILGGASRQYAKGSSIVLDGSLSMDPDQDTVEHLRYQWSCWKEYIKDEPCFVEEGLKQMTMNTSKIEVPAAMLLPKFEFVMILNVSSTDGRSQQTNQVVHIISDSPLKFGRLEIKCEQCSQDNLVNSNDAITLQTICFDCDETEQDLLYDWDLSYIIEDGDAKHYIMDPGLCYSTQHLPFNQMPLRYKRESSRRQNVDSPPTVPKVDFIPSILEENVNDQPRTDRLLDVKNNRSFSMPPFPSITEGKTSPGRRTNERGNNDIFDITEGTSDNRRDPQDPVNPNLDNMLPPVPEKDHLLLKKKLKVMLRANQTKTGLHKESLVIKPHTLYQGRTYVVTVKAKLKGQSKSTNAMTFFKVNTSPVNGTCSINPTKGRAMRDYFKLFCREWRDEHQPLRYEVRYSIPPDDHVQFLVYRGLQDKVSFPLPAGNSANNYIVHVHISVLDLHLANTSLCNFSLQVFPHSHSTTRRTYPGATYGKPTNSPDDILQEKDHSELMLSRALQQGNDQEVRQWAWYLSVQLNQLLAWKKALSRRTQMDIRYIVLHHLSNIPQRDEAEVLQTIQVLKPLTFVDSQLNKHCLEMSNKLLEQVLEESLTLYNASHTPSKDLLDMAIAVASNLIQIAAHHVSRNKEKNVYLGFVNHSIVTLENFLKSELHFHAVGEEPVRKGSEFLRIMAARINTNHIPSLEIGHAKFELPNNLTFLQTWKAENKSEVKDHFGKQQINCFVVHMVNYRQSPFTLEKVESEVSSLNVYTCSGNAVEVYQLPSNDLIAMEIPRSHEEEDVVTHHLLRKQEMNVHEFNITEQNGQQALHIVINLRPVEQGRLFPVAVLLGYHNPPTPSTHVLKKDFGRHQNKLELFLPAGYFNGSGRYFLGLVDGGYNAKRTLEGEVTVRNYSILMWWSACVFWNTSLNTWSHKGCFSTAESDHHITHCRCNHLTSFGSHVDFVPNDLSFIPVDEFFDLNKNPNTIILVLVVFCVYVVVMFLCKRLDQHDSRKGEIIYLRDNAISDQQKYEITIETGFRKGAGTTAKVSLILHGDDGMSETRELISDNEQPLFERNSRDKFILTLPDSIGKIWKIQIWHNNSGVSPSWFLSRVIIRDLNNDNVYYFLSEKWLAVEEEDGKVEREFMVLESSLPLSQILWAKGTQYLADYHLWTSLLSKPSYSQYTRTQRVTCCFTVAMVYMCLNAMWHQQIPPKFRGEFGLLDVSARNLAIGAVCVAIVIPLHVLLEFLFRRSKLQTNDPELLELKEEDKSMEFRSGKPNELSSEEDEDEIIQPIMTYSILDQSFLNWPSIQDWAQKQWMKRQPIADSPPEEKAEHNNSQPALQLSPAHQRLIGSELDQASSGFEDSNSTDPRPLLACSMSSSIKNKAPSISSTDNPKQTVSDDKRYSTSKLFLPFWCQYVAWALCIVLSLASAIVTIMYGYRFGPAKTSMWLQSLYFSFAVCFFIAQPLLILVTLVYTLTAYRHDPSILDHDEDDCLGEKSKLEIIKRKKEQKESSKEEADELEKGVSARKRSRYLRFARPPQEKELIEARKKTMKEKKVMDLFWNVIEFVGMWFLLLVMSFGKDHYAFFVMRKVIHETFQMESMGYNSVNQWYNWSQTVLLDNIYTPYYVNSSYGKQMNFPIAGCNFLLGKVKIQKSVIPLETCYMLPWMRVPTDCHNTTRHAEQINIFSANTTSFKLSRNRLEAEQFLHHLERRNWIDDQVLQITVQFTLYNPPSNIFSSILMTFNLAQTDQAMPVFDINSTYLFKYISSFDNFILACELGYIMVVLFSVKKEMNHLIKQGLKYFKEFYSVTKFSQLLLSFVYIVIYVYRFVLVNQVVNAMRNTYLEENVDVTSLAVCDKALQGLMGILVFIVMLRPLFLLQYLPRFAILGRVYQNIRREVALLAVMLLVMITAYGCLTYLIFGKTLSIFSSVWKSLSTLAFTMTISRHLISIGPEEHLLNIILLFFLIFSTGLFTSYMVAVLTNQLRVSKKKTKDTLVMNVGEAVLFFWDKFLLSSGIKNVAPVYESEDILPPEFTMAEIEYQVEELYFRINSLYGGHNLPEKTAGYLTDSDVTYGAGDDGISSAGSEIPGDEENKSQQVEDYLNSQQAFLSQQLQSETQNNPDKGFKASLEQEVFKKLQQQRIQAKNDKVKGMQATLPVEYVSKDSPTEISTNRTPRDNCYQNQPIKNEQIQKLSMGLHNLENLDRSGSQSSDSDKGPSRELRSHDSFNRKLELPSKPTFSKPGFRDLSSGSPALRQLKSSLSAVERAMCKGDNTGSAFTTESSSGSEQDALLGFQLPSCSKTQRNLRKTKSRGKGKGQVNLNSSILDEFEFEVVEPEDKDEDLIQTSEKHSSKSDMLSTLESSRHSLSGNRDTVEPSACNIEHKAEVHSYHN